MNSENNISNTIRKTTKDKICQDNIYIYYRKYNYFSYFKSFED